MLLLIAGLLIWAGVHFIPSLLPAVRAAAIVKLGPLPWKGVFALAVLAGLVLMVMGWQATTPTLLWAPSVGLRHATMALVPIALIFFFAARLPTDLKRYVRHPQLTGVKLWAVAHLLSNGDVRSLILFGGLLAWAVLEVILINRRQGRSWTRPQPVGLVKTLLSTVIALVIAGGIVHFHQYLAGVPLVG